MAVGAYPPFSVPGSTSLVVFEVVPAFAQRFHLCMNSFYKFLNTPQQMRPSVVCFVSYRIHEEKKKKNSSGNETHNIHDTMDPRTVCGDMPPLPQRRCGFTPRRNVTRRQLQYGPVTAARLHFPLWAPWVLDNSCNRRHTPAQIGRCVYFHLAAACPPTRSQICHPLLTYVGDIQ